MTVTIDNDFHAQKHFVMAQLAEIRDNLTTEVQAELALVMEKIKEAAISLCPVSSGALRSSINLEGGEIQASTNSVEWNIYAGSPDIINPISGKPTSEYALFVHDGHAMADGTFWSGTPFLEEAILMYLEELENIMDKIMKSLGETEPSASDVARQSD